MAALTLSERVDKIYDIKQQLRTELLFKGYSETEADNMLEKYPDLVRRIHGKNIELPQWFKDSVVCWYDVERQGCTNENMKAMQTRTGRAKLLDLSGNGLDMDLFGFNWSGMSGCNGYCEDFNNWNNINPQIFKIQRNDTLCHIINYSTSEFPNLGILKKIGPVESFVVKISGIPSSGFSFGYDYIESNDISKFFILKNGINKIPKSHYLEGFNAGFSVHYWDMKTPFNITIELVPEYPNALVFDGVDDYGYVNNKKLQLQDYTIIMKRQFLSSLSGFTAWKNLRGIESLFIFERCRLDVIDGYNFGSQFSTQKPKTQSLISYQTSTQYNLSAIPGKGKAITDTTEFNIGNSSNHQTKIALYSCLLFNRTLSQNEIDWVKYNLMGEELPKPIAGWTAKGRSNSEKDIPGNTGHTILPDVTGNGHHIQLKNFAFEGMSGYGGYSIPKFDESHWTAPSDRANVTFSGREVYITNIMLTTGNIIFSNTKDKTRAFVRIKITGVSSTRPIYFGQLDVSDYKMDKDGIYEFDYTFIKGSQSSTYGFRGGGWTGDCNIKITILPSYPNGLVFDGVDDYGECLNLGPLSDYTIIVNRKIGTKGFTASKSVKPHQGAFMFEKNIDSGSILVSYNYDQSLTTSSLQGLNNISWANKKEFNGLSIGTGDAKDTDTFFLACQRPGQEYADIVFYSAYIFDKSLTPSAIEAFVRKNMDPTYVLPKN